GPAFARVPSIVAPALGATADGDFLRLMNDRSPFVARRTHSTDRHRPLSFRVWPADRDDVHASRAASCKTRGSFRKTRGQTLPRFPAATRLREFAGAFAVAFHRQRDSCKSRQQVAAAIQARVADLSRSQRSDQ